jgi:RNA polymerase sigma factor (sigma-70 family)
MTYAGRGAHTSAPQPWDWVQAGVLDDEKVFSDLCAYVRPLLVRSLQRGGADDEEAEDITQDTLMVLYRKRRQIERPIAYALATSKAMLLKQRTSKWARLEYTAGDELFESVGMIDADESDRIFVIRIIASLPEQQRRVVALRYDGYMPADIARILGTDPNNVRVNLHHARARLRASLTERWVAA